MADAAGMFATLDVDVRPGSGLGIFELGASLWNVLDTLRRLQHVFPQVDVKYDPDSSLLTPVILHLRPHIDLLFTSKHQRLHTICIRRLRDAHPPVTLRYRDIVLCSPEEPLRRITVTRALGPTYPGDELKYPGLSFSFEDDPLLRTGMSDDRMQEVKRVTVSQKVRGSVERDTLDEVYECAVMDADISSAIIKLNFGVVLHFFSGSEPIAIRLGYTSAQDLNVDLGSPARVHYKEDARMAIHSAALASKEDFESDYFYNYFHLGLDLMISGKTHLVKKIIIHTNVPGSPLFQAYKRCPWELESPPEDDEDDTPPRKRFYERFETISHFLSPREPPPSMHLNRTDENENLTLPNSSSRLYGYDGIILEVSEASQILTVMLY